MAVAGTIIELDCSGETHRILISRRGRMGLLDHDRAAIRDEMALAALGDGSCRCVQALLSWREMLGQRSAEVRYKLPAELIDAILGPLSKAAKRRRDRIAADHAEADARRRPGRRFR